MSLLRGIAVFAASGAGCLCFAGAAWLVHHESVNYRLHDAGLGVLSHAAETGYAFGSVLSALGGVVLALPLLVAWARRVSLVRSAVFHALACVTMVCGLGGEALSLFGFLGVAVLLWALAMVSVVTCPTAKDGENRSAEVWVSGKK